MPVEDDSLNLSWALLFHFLMTGTEEQIIQVLMIYYCTVKV